MIPPPPSIVVAIVVAFVVAMIVVVDVVDCLRRPRFDWRIPPRPEADSNQHPAAMGGGGRGGDRC